jgi:hypothetical protein
MNDAFLLTRVLLRFDDPHLDHSADLSAVALAPDGSLWLGSDESLTVGRLSPITPHTYGKHQSFQIGQYVELFNTEEEIDIKGLTYTDHYLWLTGSHSAKRKKATGQNPEKDIERLTTIKTELNRYLLVRIPLIDGQPQHSCPHPEKPSITLTAACLQKTKKRNVLMEALKDDEHLGPFLTFPLPGKENGFDIEGFAIHSRGPGKPSRVFLGLRGPVLRGWAIMLELELEEKEPGVLALKEVGKNDQSYKKHFVDLNGMGIRELCLHGEDLIILAGPTMALEGTMRIFKLHNMLDVETSSIHSQQEGNLDVLFDLPFRFGTDHAEGMALYPCFGEDGLIIVHDTPDPDRRPDSDSVFADVFRLNP